MLRLHHVDNFLRRIPLARPFRFGIVELSHLDHLVVRGKLDIDGQSVEGFAGENLAPRWFAKDPTQSIEQDVATLLSTARAAGGLAVSIAAQPGAFDFCQTLRSEIDRALPRVPGLARQLGVSLIERCAIDACCRLARRPMHQMLRGGLGVPADAIATLPATPSSRLAVRHTVGLSDDPAELPSILATSGITRLKIKLGGNADADLDRVAKIDAACHGRIDRITLDGNENYADAMALRALLAGLRDSAALSCVRGRIAWIEQAVHRSTALGGEMTPVLREFGQFPQVIDESDGSADDLPRALACGYAGTTHKNCKGVFKSVLARATLARFEANTGRRTVFSGEDLTIVAPWSQTQDLAAAAAVGVMDIERNGHHYADGLAAFPMTVGDHAHSEHPELYERDGRGVVQLRIRSGSLDLASVNAAPFGSVAPPILDGFEPV